MSTTKTLVINHRFQGPPDSGNGGYSCGILGKYIDGPAVVRLRIPPPLDTAMEVRETADGIELYHHDQLVGTAKPAIVDIEIPQAPDFETATIASSRYRGFDSHYYPGCFVCGPDRPHGDGLRIFAGAVDQGKSPQGMVAAGWIPDESLQDEAGNVASEYVWSALDCPGAYSFPEPPTGTILLGELTVSIMASVSVGEKCVLIGWEISHEGRKHHTGTALFGESGVCCAVATAIWFEVPTDK